jgi:hypothetical protein
MRNQQEGFTMKMFVTSVLLAGLAAGLAGCATPGYSSAERFQQIGRNWDYEWKMAQDDIDHVLLLRPASRLTVWNVR